MYPGVLYFYFLLNNRSRTRPNQTPFRFAPRTKRYGTKRLTSTQNHSEKGWFFTVLSDPDPFTLKTIQIPFCTPNDTLCGQTTYADTKWH